MVTLKLLASLRYLVGCKELAVPFEAGGTVRDLIRAVGEVKPELKAKIVDDAGELTGVVQILVDGRNIVWLNGLDTIIEAENQITLIPPVAGG